MKFTENETLGFMETNLDFKGYSLKVRLELHESDDYEGVAKETVNCISNSWNDIQKSIIDSLYRRFIEDWSERSPKYSENEFLEKVYPETIDFSDYEDEYCKPTFTLYFNDSGLFGNHGIEVNWKKNEKVQKKNVNLIG